MSPLENFSPNFGLANKDYPFKQAIVFNFISGSKEEEKLLQDCKKPDSAFVALNSEQESFIFLPFALTRTVFKTDSKEFLYACSEILTTNVKGTRVHRSFVRGVEKITYKELFCRRLESKLLHSRFYIEENPHKDFFNQVKSSAPFGFDSLKSAKHPATLKTDVDLIVQVIFYEDCDLKKASTNKWVMFFAEDQNKEELNEFAEEIIEASEKVLRSISCFKRIDICIQHLFGHFGLLDNLAILTDKHEEKLSRTTKVSFMPGFPLVNAQNLIGKYEEIFGDQTTKEEPQEKSEDYVEEID